MSRAWTVRPEHVICRFVIPGEPRVKGRPRFTKYGRAYTPESTRRSEALVSAAFREAVGTYTPPEVGSYGVVAEFHCASRQRRDVDNMLKLILDGLNGLAWTDDVQVSEVVGQAHRMAPSGFTEVTIYRTPIPTPELRDCLNCGRGFDFHRNTKARYCSTECATAHKRVTRTCVVCGTEFSRPRSVSARSKAAPTCSPECYATSLTRGAGTRSAGSCDTCGAPTSKAIYVNCAPCAVRLRRRVAP